MRLVFLGSPEPAAPSLRALHAAGHDIVLTITRPDARRGRGSTTTPTPVKAAAAELGIPVAHETDDVLGVDVDLGVVVAYGRIIRPHVLEALPMVNVHFSLLPRWRGAAPVERAVLAGDDVTGVCVMDVEEGLDTGAVYACESVPIGPDTTAAELRGELAERGARLLVDTVANGLGTPTPQEGPVTYADKIERDELVLDWRRPAAELHRIVRVGGAATTFRGEQLKVHEAELVAPGSEARHSREPASLRGDVVAAGDGGGLRLRRVQPAGRTPMPWQDFANGARPADGERFG